MTSPSTPLSPSRSSSSSAEPTDAGATAGIRQSSEAGSAYLATLLVLVVLTVLGLSLAVITQTEVLIGGSEKQAARQLFSAGSGIELAATYELVNRDSAAHDMRLRTRNENMLGNNSEITDVVCTSPFLQIHTSVCNLCAMNQDTDYFAVQYAVTANALRRSDATLGSRKAVGAVVAFEPFQESFAGFQLGGERPLKAPDDLSADIDPTTEVDPCEGLYLKI